VKKGFLTPDQILKVVGKNKKYTEKPKRVVKEGRYKPHQAKKPSYHQKPKLLLETPIFSASNFLEYPSPEWLVKIGKAEVSIIVPLYKDHEFLELLLQSWNKRGEGMVVEIIFIDDCCPYNCKDIVIKELKKKNDKIFGSIYHNPLSRIGFGACCNFGVEKATGDNIIILSPNFMLPTNWLTSMIRPLRKEENGIVGCLQLTEDNKIDNAGYQWNWDKLKFDAIGNDVYNNLSLKKPFDANNAPEDLFRPGEREFVVGCMSIRKNIFEDIGGFDHNYKHHNWEQLDLCLKIKENGLKVIYQPDVKLLKIKKEFNSQKVFEYNKNYFLNKWIQSKRIDNFVGKGRINDPEIKNILIKREAAFGDVLIAAAVAPALKKKYPKSKIIFCTKHHEVLVGNPFIDRIIEDIDSTERLFQYYCNFDMAYEYRPNKPILECFADLAGVDEEDCEFYLRVDKVEGLPEKYIVIHAGQTLWAGRNWSGFKFGVIAGRLQDAGYKVVCIGMKSDHKVVCDLDLRQKTTIQEMAYVIQNADLFIGIDSLPMHIAQIMDIKGVVFFGSTDPNLRIYNKKMVALRQENLPCIACHHRKPRPCYVTEFCEIGTMDCINQISIDDMWSKTEEALSSSI